MLVGGARESHEMEGIQRRVVGERDFSCKLVLLVHLVRVTVSTHAGAPRYHHVQVQLTAPSGKCRRLGESDLAIPLLIMVKLLTSLSPLERRAVFRR